MESKDPDKYDDNYIMGRTSEEYQRLRSQAKLWEKTTARVFKKIGLKKGMRCLDVGCGPGEVMKLMGDIVGPSGQVVGLDIDGKLGHEALEVLKATSNNIFFFIECDIEKIEKVEGQPFDLTFARLIFVHLRDPIAFLRKMYDWTKPGGHILVQEYDFRTWNIYPKLDAWIELEKVFYGVADEAGRDTRIGSKLPTFYLEAEIGAPDGIDLNGFFRSLEKHTERLQAVYNSVLPRALRLGITTEEKSQTFFDEMNKAPQERYYS